MKPASSFSAIALGVAASMFAMSASAAIWTPTGGAASIGNQATALSDGVSLTATGYSTSGGGATLETGCLATFSGGLGVINRGEDNDGGSGCSGTSPNHSTDNSGYVDGVLLSFNSSVRLTAITTGWVYNGDSDMSLLYYSGAGAFSGNLTGLTLGGMLGAGWTLYTNIDGGGAGTNTFANSSTYSRYWYLSSYSSAFGGSSTGIDSSSDYFKLQSIKGYKAVPEPGTLALLGLGLAGIGFARRRRRA